MGTGALSHPHSQDQRRDQIHSQALNLQSWESLSHWPLQTALASGTLGSTQVNQVAMSIRGQAWVTRDTRLPSLGFNFPTCEMATGTRSIPAQKTLKCVISTLIPPRNKSEGQARDQGCRVERTQCLGTAALRLASTLVPCYSS